jgi:iron-sulfur cluster assembly protein
MSIVNMTPNAVENIKRLQDEFEMEGFGLRFGLTGGGCSGYKYVLELEEAPVDEDQVIEFDGVKVFLHSDHVEKLQNSTIDWVDSILESGFQIDNPQAKRPCGCGVSVDF